MRSRMLVGVQVVLAAGLVAAIFNPAAGLTQSRLPGGAASDAAGLQGMQPVASSAMTPEQLRHATPEWLTIVPHLPDPATATPQRLEMTGDVLRARKFPDEALGYYHHAMDRGGDPRVLLNKIGTTELELRMFALARLDFKRLVKLDRKNADGWNNLASIEYLEGNFGFAVQDFKKAVSLRRKNATFHANLATAYFQDKEYGRARKEFLTAAKLDPHVFDYHGAGGLSVQIQSAQDRGRFCFERARLYTLEGDEADALHWLQAAVETGFDVMEEMRWDRVMQKYRKDQRVEMMIKNNKILQQEKAVYHPDDRPRR